MKITLSQFAGFCDGVKRAFDIVSNLDMEKAKHPVCILGSLAHNQDVVRKIEEKGIRKIDLDFFLGAVPGDIGTLIISAHGVGPEVYDMAKKKSIEIIDTTCPKVIKVQRLAQVFLERGYQIVLIGDREHKEVRSIFEWGGKKPAIISSEDDLEDIDLDPAGKIVIISQTTQDVDRVSEISKRIKEKYPQAESMDTICLATENRQGELKKMAPENDALVIIGSPDSANSTRLFEIARKMNPKSIFIERADQLDPDWFSGVEKAGVTAGASTPDWVIREVLDFLISL